MFSRFGRLSRCDVKRGFGFIEFEDRKDAEDAIKDLNGSTFFNRKIVVEWSGKPKRDATRRPQQQQGCFNCGAPGHWARDCPKPSERGNGGRGGGGDRGGDRGGYGSSRRRSRSPYKRSRSPYKRSRRSPSPLRDRRRASHSRSPPRSRSPRKYSRSRSPVRSPRNYSRSPPPKIAKRSPSPKIAKRSPSV